MTIPAREVVRHHLRHRGMRAVRLVQVILQSVEAQLSQENIEVHI